MSAAITFDGHINQLTGTVHEALVHLTGMDSPDLRRLTLDALDAVEAVLRVHPDVRTAGDGLRRLLDHPLVPGPALAALESYEQAVAAALTRLSAPAVDRSSGSHPLASAPRDPVSSGAKTRVYTFWQADGPMPSYLKLCLATWHRFVPGLEVEVINHDNWKSYVGHLYDLDALKTFSLPMQSDAVSAAVLAERGGLFMDIDTLVTHNFFDDFMPLAPRRFVAFGKPNHRLIHLAILKCNEPGNPVLCTWLETLRQRIASRPPQTGWSYLGNDIFDPLLRSERYFDDYLIIDRAAYGNILEAALMPSDQPLTDYLKLYFDPALPVDAERALSAARYGLVSLHNSWTPPEYSQLSPAELLDDTCLLTRMFTTLLGKESMQEALER